MSVKDVDGGAEASTKMSFGDTVPGRLWPANMTGESMSSAKWVGGRLNVSMAVSEKSSAQGATKLTQARPVRGHGYIHLAEDQTTIPLDDVETMGLCWRWTRDRDSEAGKRDAGLDAANWDAQTQRIDAGLGGFESAN